MPIGLHVLYLNRWHAQASKVKFLMNVNSDGCISKLTWSEKSEHTSNYYLQVIPQKACALLQRTL
jgi:hypothetical protein